MARRRKKKNSSDLVLQVCEEIKGEDIELVSDALKAVMCLPQLQAMLLGVALKTPTGRRPGILVSLVDGDLEYEITIKFRRRIPTASTPSSGE
jgi:hypothetical protein